MYVFVYGYSVLKEIYMAFIIKEENRNPMKEQKSFNLVYRCFVNAGTA